MDKKKKFINKLGLGLAAIGRPGYINLGHHDDLPNKTKEGMEKQAHELLDQAWNLGLRYFDMARSYGTAESFVSSWINKNPEKLNEIQLASKWGYIYTADWQIEAEHHEIKHHTLDNYSIQIEESKTLLGSNLNVYQIHSATLESGVLENIAVLNAMAELKSEEIKIGLSLSGVNQSQVLNKAMGVEIDRVPLFEVVQVTFNILEQSLTDSLQALDTNVKVVVKEAMSNGRLASYQHQFIDQERINLLQNHIEEHNITPDQLALAFVLNQPFVDIVLSGASNLKHLNSNVKAADIELSEEVLNSLKSIKENPVEYWKTRGSLAWN